MRILPVPRRIVILLTAATLAGMILSVLNPVNSTLYRLIFLGSATGFWFGFLILLWNRKWIRIGWLALPVLIGIPFLLPGRPIDRDELRSDYVQRMIELENTTYHWGGESARGIDCSGLPRRALRDALLSYGLRHADGGAFRRFLAQWWFDTSAEAMGQGYRGFTVDLNRTGEIEGITYEDLEAGDLAVTANGIHVIVYVGEHRRLDEVSALDAIRTTRAANNLFVEAAETAGGTMNDDGWSGGWPCHVMGKGKK